MQEVGVKTDTKAVKKKEKEIRWDHLYEADVELPQFPRRAHLAPVKTQ